MSARVFIFRGGDIFLPAEQGDGKGPSFPDSGLLAAAARRDYALGGMSCVAYRFPADAAAGDPAFAGGRLVPFRAALAELPASDAAAAAKGLALLNWLDVAQRCGACGAELADKPQPDGGLARGCGACGRLFFPRISPAVIVLVRRGGRILLAHNAAFPEGRFGLIAGFVEAGESLEETCRRELREEAEVEVKNLRYVASQPWPFPDSLMLAFEADWAAGEGRPDGVEITELRWCGPEELPSIPPAGSVARRLIDGWLKSAASGGGAS
jgi:NAD+ diphosphatase